MSARILLPLLAILALALPVAAWSADPDPSLTIRAGGKALVYRRSELLKRKDLTELAIDHDPSYSGRAMRYRAVPAAALFEGVEIPRDAQLQFECLDGFSAPIDRERLLNTSPGKAIAYLAIEEPGEKWPVVTTTGSAETRTPAPFYLVWVNPKLSGISPEEWPFELSGFVAKPSLSGQYPKIVPDPKLPASSKAARGFKVFAKNCFPCHTLNGQGQATLGPDLNLPMNPTEYMSEKSLRTLIRDPQALRRWPAAKMTGFGRQALPDEELDEVIAYLRHMTGRK